MEQTGIISRIQHFSTGDGDGIRTTVFFAGCSLRCPWCHNPETQTLRALMFRDADCRRCGACAAVCPNGVHRLRDGEHFLDRARCTHCGECAAVCPAHALELSGREVGVEELLRELLHDRDFYAASGGGVTLSGGEPLCQPEFAAAIAAACRREGLSVTVETAGCVPAGALLRLLPYTDVWYYDLKAPDPAGYAPLGGDGATVFDNLRRLIAAGADTVARIPVIPGHNDSETAFAAYARALGAMGLRRAHLLGFHRLGSAKYTELGRDYAYVDCAPPARGRLEALAGILVGAGIDARVV